MPPKKGKATKKKNARLSDDDDNLPQIDVQYNPDIIDGLLQELEQQMEIKCSQLQKDSDFMITSIQQAFHLELIKLPTQVKNMSLSRFKEEFGGSLETVTKGPISAPLANRTNMQKNAAPVVGTASKSTRAASKVFETPAGPKKTTGLQGLNTAMRNPREGERIYSDNGSPLGDFKTVVKAPKAGGSSLVIPPTPNVIVPLDSGAVLDMEQVDVSTLSEDLKEDALMKMQAMMNSIKMCMSKLEQGKSVM
jgi:Nbl1 / Borealin N terminal/Cell division cycle-associated protein 8